MNIRVGTVLLSAAIAASGWWLSEGLLRFKTGDRYVTVKGLAEREMPADLVVWPITFTLTGNDLPALYEQIQGNAQRIGAFLQAQGLKDAEQTLGTPRIEDFDAHGYRENRGANRYKTDVTLTVRSADVPAVIKAMRASGELVKAGVALASWGPAPEFRYTKLNELKPELLAQATENARKAAEQFAKDSASRVGRIRTANQGQIGIADRDAGTPQVKAIRVVTTVEYELLDD